MRWFLPVLVVGCGAMPSPSNTRPARPAQPAPSTVVEIVPEASPVPKPRPEPSRRTRWAPGAAVIEHRPLLSSDDAPIVIDRPRLIDQRQIAVSDSEFLSRCVRDFVQAQPSSARRSFITALTIYSTSCDREGRVVLEYPLGPDSQGRRGRTDVGFTGTLSAQRLDLALRVAFCGGESASPDRVSITSEGNRWTSQRLEFSRDANGCDVAEIAYTSSLGRALARVVATTDAVIRFEGTQLSGDLVVTDPMRNELRVILEALDARAAAQP